MIGVVLKTSSEKERSKAIQELLNYGFKNFKQVTVKNAGEIVDSIEVKNGKKLSVSLKLDSDISTVIPVGRENDLQIVTSKKAEFLNARYLWIFLQEPLRFSLTEKQLQPQPCPLRKKRNVLDFLP